MKIVLSVEFLDASIDDGWHPVGLGDTEDAEVALKAIMNPDLTRLKRHWISTAREESEKGRILGFAIVRNGERRRMELATMESRAGDNLRKIFSQWIGYLRAMPDFQDYFINHTTLSGAIEFCKFLNIRTDLYVSKIAQRVFDEIFLVELAKAETIEIAPWIGDDSYLLTYAQEVSRHRNDPAQLERMHLSMLKDFADLSSHAREIVKAIIIFLMIFEGKKSVPFDVLKMITQEMSSLVNEYNYKLAKGQTFRQASDALADSVGLRIRQIMYEELTDQEFLLCAYQKSLLDEET